MASASKLPEGKFRDPRDPERGESPPPASVSPKAREEPPHIAIKIPYSEKAANEQNFQKMAARWLPALRDSTLTNGGRRKRRQTKKAGRRRRATRRRT
jgi:hypothetical protein